MPIRFLCPNGHKLIVPDERAGKKGKCPECRVRVYIPQAGLPGARPTAPAVATFGARQEEPREDDFDDDLDEPIIAEDRVALDSEELFRSGSLAEPDQIVVWNEAPLAAPLDDLDFANAPLAAPPDVPLAG